MIESKSKNIGQRQLLISAILATIFVVMLSGCLSIDVTSQFVSSATLPASTLKTIDATATLVRSTTIPNPTATYSSNLATAIAEGSCLQSFHSFAYQGYLPIHRLDSMVSPVYPWQHITMIPSYQIVGSIEPIPVFEAAISRELNEEIEIWFIGRKYGHPRTKGIIYIYNTSQQTWKYIDPRVGNDGAFVRSLFVTSDGKVWGGMTLEITSTSFDQTGAMLTTAPVLSLFNDDAGRFEIAENVIEIPPFRNNRGIGDSDLTYILLDPTDRFWFFVQFDGLYLYDPVIQFTEKQIDLDINVGDADYAPDGSLYYREREYYFMNEELFQFIPETREVVTTTTPGRSWPVSGNMIVDHTGRLWLGSTGYRDIDHSWHLIHPYPEESIEHSGNFLWSTPRLFMESSDGKLWYRRYLDTFGWAEGTAWYDPDTNEGCMFTNYDSSIIEDSKNRLWLVAGGNLYMHSLNTD
jgi:hypothetical protein